jgi:hypothetical protein
MDYEFDETLSGTRQEQAWAQVAYTAYVKHIEEGSSWKELHRDYKQAWIFAVRAMRASMEPSGPG